MLGDRLTCPAKFMKIFLYILQNRNSKYYIGITKLSVDARLARHNKGDVYATRFGRPWKIVCTEEFDSYVEARVREKQIKSWHGGNAFRKFVARAAGSSNGRTPPFGGGYEGPNPSPAALAGSK